MCKQLHNKPKYNKICFISFVNVPQGFKAKVIRNKFTQWKKSKCMPHIKHQKFFCINIMDYNVSMF